MLAAVRGLNRLERVGETVRAALNELAVVAPDWLQALAPPAWYERYGRRVEAYRLPKAEKERLELAATIGADGDQLLAAIDAAVEPWLAQLPAIQVLRQVWTAQYTKEDGQLRWHIVQEMPATAEQIYISVHDPEARYGKKRDISWTGYIDLVGGGLNGAGLGDGWYSYNLGSWHLISLNIQCYTQPDTRGTDGCSGTNTWFASELKWLKKDLEENHSECTLAYWHQPSFSAADSLSEEGTTALAFWQLLYEHHADLVLNGHDHLYARYRPLDPSGNYDPKRGIREFIVGTGGETLDKVVTVPTSPADTGATFNAANLDAATGNYWGVMALTLDEHGYKWDFESALELPGVPAGTYSDKGVGSCHDSDNR